MIAILFFLFFLPVQAMDNLEDFWKKIQNNEIPVEPIISGEPSDTLEGHDPVEGLLTYNNEFIDEGTDSQAQPFNPSFGQTQQYLWRSKHSPRRTKKALLEDKILFRYQCRLCGQCLAKDSIDYHEDICAINLHPAVEVLEHEQPGAKKRKMQEEVTRRVEVKEQACNSCGGSFPLDKIENHEELCENAWLTYQKSKNRNMFFK